MPRTNPSPKRPAEQCQPLFTSLGRSTHPVDSYDPPSSLPELSIWRKQPGCKQDSCNDTDSEYTLLVSTGVEGLSRKSASLLQAFQCQTSHIHTLSVRIKATSTPANTTAVGMARANTFQRAHLLWIPSAPLSAQQLAHSLMVHQDLCPANQAQRHEHLRLDLQRDVEVLDNRIRAKGNTAWALCRVSHARDDKLRMTEHLHSAHRNIISAGSPSVFLVRQFVHICGTS